MIDPKDVGLRKHRMHRDIQCFCRGQVVPERLLHDDPCSCRTAGNFEGLGYSREQAGWNGEIVSGLSRVAKRSSEGGESRRAPIVSVDVLKQLHETSKRGVIHAASELLDAVTRSLPQLVN